MKNIDVSGDLGFFEKVGNFASLEACPSDKSKYILKDLKGEEIDLLRDMILNLEQNENVTLCTRGQSKADKKMHKAFINNELYDLFIVGDKAQYHINEKINNINIFSTRDKDILLDDVKKLLLSVNKELNKHSSRYLGEVEGQFNDKLIHDLMDENKYVIETWELFLYSLLHNHGDNFFKPYSFFISLTQGNNKYKTAKHFALNAKRKDIGFIFVYILSKNRNNYIKSSELTKQLEEYGIKWFPDIDNETMVINGLYPHNIIGIFEVENENIKRFILNNWFYEQMKQDSSYDFSQGVSVDQGENLEKFMNSARKMNIRTYFSTDGSPNGNELISEIEGSNPRDVSI